MISCMRWILRLILIISIPINGTCVFSNRTPQRSSTRSINNRRELYRNGSMYIALGSHHRSSTASHYVSHHHTNNCTHYDHYNAVGNAPIHNNTALPARTPSFLQQLIAQSSSPWHQNDSEAHELIKAYTLLLQSSADDSCTNDTIPYEQRIQALHKSVRSGHVIIHEKFTVSSTVQEWLPELDPPLENLTHCDGNLYQLQLHQEMIDLLDEASLLRTNTTHGGIVHDLGASVGEYACIGNAYNRDGEIISATRVIDLCHTIIEFGQAIAEGVFEGAYAAGADGWQSVQSAASTVNNACRHPVQTVVKAYSSTKAIGNKIVNATQYSLTLIERLADRLACVIYDACEITEFCIQDPQAGQNVITAGIQDMQQDMATAVALINNLASALPAAITPDNVRLGSAFVAEHGLKLTTSHLCGKLYGHIAHHAFSYAATLAHKTAQGAEAGGKACFNLAHKTAQRVAHGITDSIHVTGVVKKITHYSMAEHEIALLAAKYIDGIAAPLSVVKAINKTRLKITEKFLKHIFGLESKVVGTVEKLSGLHHDYMGELEAKGIIKLVNKTVCPITGIVTGNIELYNGIKKGARTTLFPAIWTRETVLKKIHEGLVNAKNNKPRLQGGNWLLEGITSEGITIEYLLDKKARLISVYPILR